MITIRISRKGADAQRKTKKLNFVSFAIAFFTISGLQLSAQGITVSGILDSSVSMLTANEEVFLGIEEYANLRMQAKLRDRGTFYGAVNFIAAAGSYAANVEFSPYMIYSVNPDNYVAAIELERLYFRLNFETAYFDGGLFRLPFGYGQVWGPTDFLNPKNPLNPDARPRAVLGAGLSFYPNNETKLLGFGTAPRNPFLQGVKGWLAGISMDRHFEIGSIQALYSFETPKDGSNKGIHRIGFSIKTDIRAGFVIDTLYTYNYEANTGLDGLSFSVGADYSFFDGDLIVLAEYLYNGKTSSTAKGYGGSFTNNHYLYTGFTLRFNDYTNMNAAAIIGFDDTSFIPVISLNHDLFQGAVLTVSAQMPAERCFVFSTKLRLRF